jgi:hypothetical protein
LVLCRLRRDSLCLLLGNLDLRVGVGTFDELPATGPTERPDHERHRESDVPRGDGELLPSEYAVAVAGSVTPPRAATLVAWLTPTPPGVTETMLAIELPPMTDITVWNVTAIP